GTFTVGASSSDGLTFQWRFNSADRIGRTNARLELPSCNTNQSGAYRVVVTHPSASVTSQVAILSVNTRVYCYGGYALIPSPPGYLFGCLSLLSVTGFNLC